MTSDPRALHEPLEVDPALALARLDTQAPTLRTQARTVVVPEMERLGVRRPDGGLHLPQPGRLGRVDPYLLLTRSSDPRLTGDR